MSHSAQDDAAMTALDGATGAERLRKAPNAYRTISEVADDLHVPQHVLRFWETRFPEVRPLKRGGGRRYYRPEDIDILRRISELLYIQGYTIKGVQRVLRGHGPAEDLADVDTEIAVGVAGGGGEFDGPGEMPGLIDEPVAAPGVVPETGTGEDAAVAAAPVQAAFSADHGTPDAAEAAMARAELADALDEAAALRIERRRLRTSLRDVLEELRQIRSQLSV